MNNLDIASQFGILNRRSQAFVTASCKNIGIGFSEYVLLMALYRREGINQEDMSAVLFIDKAATARIIKSLEKKGFIKREQSSEDKRAKKVYLTEKGEAAKKPIFAILDQWINFLHEGIDEETFQIVRNGLKNLADRASSSEYNKLLRK